MNSCSIKVLEEKRDEGESNHNNRANKLSIGQPIRVVMISGVRLFSIDLHARCKTMQWWAACEAAGISIQVGSRFPVDIRNYWLVIILGLLLLTFLRLGEEFH